MSPSPRTLSVNSLSRGNWCKLICGASFQHIPSIRNLALAYTLAGVDCIDVAADAAVVNAAREGMAAAMNLQMEARQKGFIAEKMPWLMVSLNDGEDPHFRKATFDADLCPADCLRPCVNICPAEAIVFAGVVSGVVAPRCYGCGRCLPVCPYDYITTETHVTAPTAIGGFLTEIAPDAIEIHTQLGRLEDFQRLWGGLAAIVGELKLVAISCGDGDGVVSYLGEIAKLVDTVQRKYAIVWQTDGRPMSGDIGKGTTHAAIGFGQKVLAANLPGFVQLAGGTNEYTVPKLRELGLLSPHSEGTRSIAGVAYGSCARVALAAILEELDGQRVGKLEDRPSLLWQAVDRAASLVTPLKNATVNF
jgi:Fe-S-cluster-containing hydrogenase component 2